MAGLDLQDKPARGNAQKALPGDAVVPPATTRKVSEASTTITTTTISTITASRSDGKGGKRKKSKRSAAPSDGVTCAVAAGAAAAGYTGAVSDALDEQFNALPVSALPAAAVADSLAEQYNALKVSVPVREQSGSLRARRSVETPPLPSVEGVTAEHLATARVLYDRNLSLLVEKVTKGKRGAYRVKMDPSGLITDVQLMKSVSAPAPNCFNLIIPKPHPDGTPRPPSFGSFEQLRSFQVQIADILSTDLRKVLDASEYSYLATSGAAPALLPVAEQQVEELTRRFGALPEPPIKHQVDLQRLAEKERNLEEAAKQEAWEDEPEMSFEQLLQSEKEEEEKARQERQAALAAQPPPPAPVPQVSLLQQLHQQLTDNNAPWPGR
jgi:hypothetical protein